MDLLEYIHVFFMLIEVLKRQCKGKPPATDLKHTIQPHVAY